MAHRIELRGQLSVHRHCLGESSSPAAVRRACDATPDLGQFRAPIHGVAGTVLDGMGRGHSIGCRSGGRVCSGICAGEYSVLRFRLGDARSGERRGGLRTDSADQAKAIVPDVGNVRGCDVTVTQVSLVGLCVGLLRLACLSSAGRHGVHT